MLQKNVPERPAIDPVKKGELDGLGPIEKYASALTAWLLNDPVTAAVLAQ